MREQEKILRQSLATLGVSVSAEVAQQLMQYVQLLAKWNQIYNLTAIRDPEQMIYQHVLDSLAILPHLSSDIRRIIDVGSGGGMPGMLLAIVKPDWAVVLLDSNQKKTTFLRQAVIELNLNNVEVVTSRVEVYYPLLKFDMITARAFSELARLVELTRHLLAKKGHYIALKGIVPDEEIAQLPADVVVENIIALQVPQLNAQRHLIKMRVQLGGADG